MLGWLAAFCLFWVVASIYLGGLDVELEGGSGLRQFLGLIAMLLLFMAVWRLLAGLFGGVGGLPGVVLPFGVTVLATPLLARLSFRLVGVKLHKSAVAH